MRKYGAMAKVRDRTGVLDRLGDEIRIELGCGDSPLEPGVVGIDEQDLPGVDLVGDVFDVLGEFPDGSVAAAGASHFLEHVDDLERLMSELARVMRPAAPLTVTVPHHSNPLHHSDPTHRRTFGLYSFAYLARDDFGFQRVVPGYARGPFVLRDVHLDFRCPQVHAVHKRIRTALTGILNRSPHRLEFYERNLTSYLSCFDLTATLERTA